MNPPFALHFTRPIRALRKAAWTCAALGHPVHWDDPMPVRPSSSTGR